MSTAEKNMSALPIGTGINIAGTINRALRRRRVRAAIKYGGDAALIALAYYCSFLLRFDGVMPARYEQIFIYSVGLVVLTKIILLHTMGAYGYVWQRTSLGDLVNLSKALSLASLFILADYAMSIGQINIPRSVTVFDWILSLFFLSVFRAIPRVARENSFPFVASVRQIGMPKQIKAPVQNILLYGAGDLGASLISEIERKFDGSKKVLGFIDDDPTLRGMRIRGVEVLGDHTALPRIAARHRIDEIIVAISAISGRHLQDVVERCRQFSANVQVAPGLDELFQGKVKVSDLREVQIEDLLGREAAKVELDEQGLHSFLAGRIVLVTGAGGSIGGELCFQILKFQPRKIILLGRGENSIYATKQRLLPHAGDVELEEVIGDIINFPKLDHIFATKRPELVFHAAADKHVPLMELNPDEAVLNNVVGTQNVLDAASKYGVKKVVCISSDKAVNPTSVMGCCKRVTEMLVLSRVGSPTVSCAVRFGNVLGSRGSVVPLFKKQIADGGPITITHPEITRYFMTIPEAVLLVLQAGAISAGGEIFLLEMGEQIRIQDLARQMVRLSGLPEHSIEIKYVGLRPGEKLYEELSFPHETLHRTALPKLYELEGSTVSRTILDPQIRRLKTMGIDMDFAAIRQTLTELVPEYRPHGESIADSELALN